MDFGTGSEANFSIAETEMFKGPQPKGFDNRLGTEVNFFQGN